MFIYRLKLKVEKLKVALKLDKSVETQNTNTEEMRTDIHASSGIRTHDPSV
jgi:hypothetical protein